MCDASKADNIGCSGIDIIPIVLARVINVALGLIQQFLFYILLFELDNNIRNSKLRLHRFNKIKL